MKRILFVDDETELLSSLRVRLHKHRTEWQMVFLDSGPAALAELQRQPADMIVTDVRMPGMDGKQLLNTVKAQWPETIRIVLSGFAEQLQLLQLVSLAHQYLSKPCDAQHLENIIERCFKLQALLQADHVRTLVGRVSSLPTMPKVYAQLQQALADPNISSNRIADIISSDAVIASKILQVANSAFFRLPKPVNRIKDAVTHLGFASIRNLVMSAEIFSRWQNTRGPAGIDVEQVQAHALTTAAACAALAADRTQIDDAWLLGLVHDLGYWIMIQECPAQLDSALRIASEQGLSSLHAETHVMGATHAEIGAYLLGLWGLPYSLVEAVAYHHSPLVVGQRFDLSGILATAHSLLAQDSAQALPLGDESRATMDEAIFISLEPPFDWQEAQRRVQTIHSNT